MNATDPQHFQDAERELLDMLSLPKNTRQQTELRLIRVKVKSESLAHAASVALSHLRSDESGCVK